MNNIEIKVILSTVGTLVASMILAIMNAVSDNPSLLSRLPFWLQFVLITIIPPVIAFLTGYLTPSKTSTVSSQFKEI